jgi:lipoate-protein ligase B
VTVIWELGCVDYAKALKLQREFHRQRLLEEIPDVLLLLEHAPTITIGKSGTVDNVLAAKEQLAEEGVALFFIERGGDATYHGPGQIVGYPIMDLKVRGKDIGRFVHDIEDVIIRTMDDFSIPTDRDPNHPGLWVDNQELAAIGLSIRRWVSMHGFAINVNTKMEHFSLINPCGFTDRQATSMESILGENVPLKAVKERLMIRFSEVFDYNAEYKATLMGQGL